VSGAVIPFAKSERERPVCERSPSQQRQDDRDIREARLVKEARGEADNWLGVAFLALIRVMDDQQRRKLEAFLTISAFAGENYHAEQALAVVHFATGSPERVGRVAELLSRMNGVGL